MDEVLGRVPDSIAVDRNLALSLETIGVTNWYRLVYILSKAKTDHRARTATLERMTVWYHQSFHMLYKWWTACYQEASLSLAYRHCH